LTSGAPGFAPLSSASYRNDDPGRGLADPERLCRADRLANVAGGKMPVMLLDHAGVGMAEVPGDHHQRNAVHDHERGIGVAQGVERCGRDNLGDSAGFYRWALRMRLAPGRPG
jgi:hypothetical protein